MKDRILRIISELIPNNLVFGSRIRKRLTEEKLFCPDVFVFHIAKVHQQQQYHFHP